MNRFRSRSLLAGVGVLALLFASAVVVRSALADVTASVLPGVTISDVSNTTGFQIAKQVKFPSSYAPIAFANGTGAGQVDAMWADTRTYSATSTTLDLTTLAAAATNTGAASFSNIKILAIYNNDSTNTLTVGAAASTPFAGPLGGTSPTITIQPGGCAMFVNKNADGWACSTNKSLKIDPGPNNISATVVLAGE